MATEAAATRRARAGLFFGPLLIRSCNLGFLYGPFPVGDMPLFTSFLFHAVGFIFLLRHFGCGMFELPPIFTRFQPFLPIFHPCFLPTMGNPRR